MTVSLATGRTGCHAGWGEPAACRDSGQDAGCARDLPWPRPRLVTTAEGDRVSVDGCRLAPGSGCPCGSGELEPGLGRGGLHRMGRLTSSPGWKRRPMRRWRWSQVERIGVQSPPRGRTESGAGDTRPRRVSGTRAHRRVISQPGTAGCSAAVQPSCGKWHPSRSRPGCGLSARSAAGGDPPRGT